MSDLLHCVDIHRSFRTGGKVQHVLKGADFRVEPGEMVSLLGPSGSGKSTLLHILGLLDKPDRGEVWYGGGRVDRLSPREKARIRNRRIGFVFQFYHLIPELTALQNILLSGMMGASLPGWMARRRAMKAKALDLLDRMGIADQADKKPNKLSGGERQRVALARALFSSPPVVFCDEPTGNLDRETADEIMDLLEEFHRREGTAFVIVTHDPHVAARASRRVYLEDGRIVEAPHRAKASPPGLVIPNLEEAPGENGPDR